MRITYSETVKKFAESFSTLTPQLQIAARYFMDHPGEVGLNSMRTVAAAAGVTPATVSRLSKALGFRNYDQLREPFRQRLRREAPGYSTRLRAVQRRGSVAAEALFEELRAQDIDNIQRSLADEQYPILQAVAETMLKSRRVYVLGLRGAYSTAFLFHYTYQLFRDNSKLVTARAGVFADQIRSIGKADSMLVISFTPYTQLTIDAVGYAREEGASIIAITDSKTSPAALAATHTIITRHKSPSFYHSFTAAIAVSQAIITLLVANTGGDAMKIIKKAEKQLSRISAYW